MEEDDDSALKRSTRSMRLKKEREDQAGYRRSTVALSPSALAVVERLQSHLSLGSREAVINAVFERIDSDMYLRHEFFRREGFGSPPPSLQFESAGEPLDDQPFSATTCK